MSVAPSFEARFSDGGLAIAEHRGVLVMVWRGEPTAARIERAASAFTAVSDRSRGEQLSLLAVIEERSPPPRIEHLPMVVRGFDHVADRLRANVGVLEDRIAASTVLEAAATIRALQRRPCPTKFCADAMEACTWLSARHPHEGPCAAFSAELLEAISATRARLEAA